MNYKSFHDLSRTITHQLHKVPKDVDLVVGVPKGGVLAGCMVALSLNVPIVDIDGFLDGGSPHHGFTRRTKKNVSSSRSAMHVLVVDDGMVSGGTLDHVKKLIAEASIDQRISFCAIYADPASIGKAEVHLEVLEGPHHFEWNLQRSGLLADCCIDIDGVLCKDPTCFENDGDGPAYQQFLQRALPLSLPSHEIGYLVTSRLEKYRSQTEAWLHAHGFRYKKLHMLDLPDAATRRKLNAPGKHKAEVFGMYPHSPLFIESSIREAIEIAHLSKRPVLCFSDHKIYTESSNMPPPAIRRGGVGSRITHKAKKAFALVSDIRISQLRRKPMQYKSFVDLAQAIVSHHHRIPRDVDLIVGISRSGMLAGSLLALMRDIPIIDVDGFVTNRRPRFGADSKRAGSALPQDAKHILLVDDTIFGGKSMAEARQQVQIASSGQRVTSCAIYAHPKRAQLVDVYFEHLESPGCQEWNFLHRDKAEAFCMELEGVLCRFPSPEEKAADASYREYVTNAEPFYLPSHRIGWIITARSESYRKETEEWLAKNGIVYKQLYMMKRENEGADAWTEVRFKSKIFRSHRESLLFIDGAARTAKEISRLTGKTALSLADQQVFIPEISFAYLRRRVKRYKERLFRSLLENFAGNGLRTAGHVEV